ncbi:hypothetical protein UC8_16510 [Roseimaritima ulvae]|uniref:Uncharacterized protein n=1 Tax=Roseimaritima ulvae TaxID=980254 RepID=A0A5B9QQ62_9BACT|nr:hypothetical protein UC8_16510 [Roseimaritima ulvae]
MRKELLMGYAGFCLCVCIWFSIAAANGWRAPNFGFLDGSSGGSSYGRSYGGSWGGGK